MSQQDPAPVGAPCWIELSTSDPERTQPFYNDLFGWTCDAAGDEYGGYFNFAKDGGRVAGGMRNDGTGGPDGWLVYLAVDDAQAVTDAVASDGGSVIVPPMEVMELGTMLVVTDPGGAAIGGWKYGTHTGFEAQGEPGTPSWFELHTRDYDASVAFYERVFQWPAHVASDETDFRYTTYGADDDARAGIMDAAGFLPEGVPAMWSVYFEVADARAALERVGALGGSVVQAAEDTPYRRLATAADPAGAAFKLRQPSA